MKRKIRGKAWHGWAYYSPEWSGDGLSHFAEAERPKATAPMKPGRWVRVKFVVVDGVAHRRKGK
jgi:hypothetical protein